MTPEEIKNIEKEIEAELKEAACWYGSWAELRKVIDQLEDAENEAAFDRFYSGDSGYSAAEEAERMYKIQQTLK